MRPRVSFFIACLLVALLPCWATAGMPAPLPSGLEYVTGSSDTATPPAGLTNIAVARLQAISFFLAVLLFVAAVVRWLWNYLQRDFPKLPRLSYGKALASVVLWGLLFILVLTMISGARELMTPGAWKQQGFTYKLATAADETSDDSSVLLRRRHLERLRTALWRYAATHGGRFPAPADATAIPAELWQVPEAGGLHYQYVPGLSANDRPTLLVYEPELEASRRFALQTDGDLVRLTSREIEQRKEGQRP